jgi:Concanavalin A-like lectin/glucanases superfamily
MSHPKLETWTLDNLDRIGGHPVQVDGSPRLIRVGSAQAVAFDGVADRLLVMGSPLGGARAFTVEALFQPEAGLNARNDPRFLNVMDPDDPAAKRLTVEIRVTPEGQWALDAMLKTDAGEVALLDMSRLHPTGRWAHAAVVYDGAALRTFVDGRPELEGAVAHKESVLAPGAIVSIGCRMNKVHWFQGAIRALRFTQAALSPGEFLKL